jgi:hypothetical protein
VEHVARFVEAPELPQRLSSSTSFSKFSIASGVCG